MFISFEGGEGVGKSTQCNLLLQAFERLSIHAVLTREPGGTEGAEAIRNLLVTGDVNRWDPITELLLHTAARRDHFNRFIKPHLERNNVVICDRFYDSTFAYQGFGHQTGIAFIDMLHAEVLGNTQPDLTFILLGNVTACLERAKKISGNETRYEHMQQEFHERVHQGYKAAAERYSHRCVILNANQSPETIHSEILTQLNQRFQLTLSSKE